MEVCRIIGLSLSGPAALWVFRILAVSLCLVLKHEHQAFSLQ